MPTSAEVTTHVTHEKVRELAGMLSDVLDLMKQLKRGEVVSGQWIAAREMRIVEARIALEPVEALALAETEREREPTATTAGL